MTVEALKSRIADLEQAIATGKDKLRAIAESNAKISEQAAAKRAENQTAGRGLGGMLFGPKYRAAVRLSAAASNATLAQEVAQKRAQLAESKRETQERIRARQHELKELKSALRIQERSARAASGAGSRRTADAKKSIDLLHKLREAHALGLLTDDEYERKRKELAERV